MDLRKIKTLIQLLQESELAEIEIRDGEESVRLSRASTVTAAPAAPAAPAVAVAAAPPAAPEPEPAPEPAPPAQPEGEQVISPMVGTFYAAPSPTSPAFVKVGDRVNAGDVLCVIEAMKTMNHIESEYSGEVAAVLVENSEPVEYGQPLFIIRT
ncbi:MAG: acetyl-CoA carboxylase biotin carboxyl carrier protein [Gammaproteobacteria bacterium]|nr:acetyl-CoA carboxylase biotin carboxyl carrier protein [Gammaproteobacteria bacterium]MYH34753.1 acetyl-CoA carboxylase biotin carboxyl carrier protein [Gammaproteobacteria bacterium]MYL01952.1 acetyl-CoA carboxylase biotin carboxyl carrier protein [Gammaproteobacteria bacterium]